MKLKLSTLYAFVFLSVSFSAVSTIHAFDIPIYDQSFEAASDWIPDNGVWQMGTPTSGPGGCHSGSGCAGTNLAGDYPNNTDSRLIGPTFILPDDLTPNEEILLKFWHWFNYYPYNVSASRDWGQVQISTYDETSGWSGWSDIGANVQDSSGGWSLKAVELSPYAGQQVRIAFYHTADGGYARAGWYIDDIQLVRRTPVFNGDFELGGMDWSADRGVWQIGAPTNGPGACYEGDQCAGTVLDGNYPDYTDSKLIGPTFTVPDDLGTTEEVHLRFWQWFNYYPYNVSASRDWGQVQISTYDEVSGWSGWEDIGSIVQDRSGGWTQKAVELTPYAGQKVRIAFYHTSDGGYAGTGWYIDNVQIVRRTPVFTGDFEFGWMDWFADNGVWQIGAPSSGPGSCYDGNQCAGTLIDADYPDYTDSRLISATFIIPNDLTANEKIHLRFWNWFNYYPYNVSASKDWGQVQISTYDEESGWSGWINIGAIVRDSSGGWTEKSVELTPYAGQQARIAFYHTADGGYTRSGWFIDNIEMVLEELNPPASVTRSIVPRISNVYFSGYVPDHCTAFIDVSATDPIGGLLNYIWQLPDGGTLEGADTNMEFIPPEIRLAPYRVRVTAWSEATQLAAFSRTLNIFTQVVHDYEPDGDIDAVDLHQFANAFVADDLARFAMELGNIACQ